MMFDKSTDEYGRYGAIVWIGNKIVFIALVVRVVPRLMTERLNRASE